MDIFNIVREQLYLEEKYVLRKLRKKLTGKSRLKYIKDHQKDMLKIDKDHYKWMTNLAKTEYKGKKRKAAYLQFKKDKHTGASLRRSGRYMKRLNRLGKNKGS